MLFWLVFWALVEPILWCVSAWFVVWFAYVGMLCGKRNFARRRRFFPYTFFYQCCVAFCGKSCAEEEDRSVAQSSSSFMLRVKTVWVVVHNCSIVASTRDA